jgi:hypothetical protein
VHDRIAVNTDDMRSRRRGLAETARPPARFLEVEMVIRRLGALSVAKIAGVGYTLVGLLFGAGVSLVSLVGAGPAGESALFGVAAVIVLPLFYGALGFAGALVTAWAYNVIAARIGGIEVDMQ